MTDRFDVYGEPDEEFYRLCSSCRTLRNDVFWRDGRYLCNVCAE